MHFCRQFYFHNKYFHNKYLQEAKKHHNKIFILCIAFQNENLFKYSL